MIDLTAELKAVVSEEYRIAIDDMLKNENITSNAELILKLCQLITKKIDIVERKKYFPWLNGLGSIYVKSNNNIGDEEEQQLMVYGAQLIYSLRTFLQDEEITFHMASKAKDGRYEASAFVPQKQVLSSLTALPNKAIGVSAAIQRELIEKNRTNELFNIKRKNMWQRVEYLSEARYLSGKNVNKIDMRKSGAKYAHWAYQSQKKDNMVYLKFAGNQIVKYYNLDGGHTASSLMDFNNGWLWEWYNKILYGGSEEEYASVTNSLNAGSLRPIMLGKDWTPGTKEGDFQDLQNRQIQSKYANSKIISFNNIRHVLYDLEKALVQYINEKQNASNKLVEILHEHFFPESAYVGNAYANDTVDKLLNKFNAKNF